MSKTSKIRRARKARDKAVYDAKLTAIIAQQAEKRAASAKAELEQLQSSWEYHQKAVIQVLGPNTSLLEARTFRSDQPIRRMDSYHPVMTSAAPTIADVRDTEISTQRMHEIQVCFHQIEDEFMKQLRREVHLIREDGDNFYYAHTLSRDEKAQPVEAQKHMISNLFNAAKTRYLEEFERTYTNPKESK